MPIQDKKESGLTVGIPSNQIDNLGLRPEQPIQDTPEKSGFVEVADAALRKDNYVTRIVHGDSNPYKGQANPNFDPLTAIEGYEDHAKWFSEANSAKEVEWIKQQVDQDRAYSDTLKRAGGWGTAAQIVAGTITPDIAIGGVGAASKLVKGASVGAKIVAGMKDAAAVGAISGTLYGAGQNVGNTSRDGLDIVKDAAMFSTAGALLSPVFHGAGKLIGAAGKKIMPTVVEPIAEHAPDEFTIHQVAGQVKQYTEAASQHIASNAPHLADEQAERLTAEIQSSKSMAALNEAANADQLTIAMGHQPPTVKPPYVAPQLGDMDLVGAFGTQKIGIGQAGVALANSRFTEAKIAAQKLFRDMRWRKGNLDGTFTTLPSAETEFERLGHGAAGQGLEKQNQLFDQYQKTGWQTPQTLAWVKQTFGKDKMSFKEFDEAIGSAMSNADRHPVKEVQDVARHGRTLIDSLAGEASNLGLLDTSGNLKGTALSYFGRSYDKELIVRQSSAFKQTLLNEFTLSNPGWSQAELEQAAQNAYDHIINGSDKSLTNIKTLVQDANGQFIPIKQRTKTSVAMERQLEIDDNVLEPWLDKSYSKFLSRYTGTVGHDVALTKMIGDSTGDILLGNLRSEAALEESKISASLIPDAEKEIALTKLHQELKDAEYHLKNGVALLNGTYKLSNNPNKTAATIAHNLTTFSYITKMGGAALSSIGDLTRNVLVFGLGPTLKHTIPSIRQAMGTIFKSPSIKDPMYSQIVEMNKRIGIGMEAVLHNRNLSAADIIERNAGNDGIVTKSLDYVSNRMGKINLLDALTDFQKQLTGVLSNDEFIRSTVAEAAGTASERELANLRRFGISPDMSLRIAGEFNTGVARGHNIIKDNFHFTDTNAWQDKDAAAVLERALSTATHSVVYNPSAGAKMVIPENLAGRNLESIMTQFMSFNWGSHIQHTVPMLQKMDRQTWEFAATSLIFGAMVYEMKQIVKFADGKERPERNWKEVMYDTLDQSSLLSLPFQVNSVLSGVSRKMDARSYLLGSEHPTLSATNFNLGSLFGAAGQSVANAYGAVSDISNDVVDRRTISKIRQLIPFQNLFYLRSLFDIGERQAQEMLDVPDRATVTFTRKTK